MNRTLITAFVIAATLPLGAADFAARKQLQQRSMAEGIGAAQVPLLGVKAGPGPENALNAIKSRLARGAEKITLSGTPRAEKYSRGMVQATDSWRLEVAADGRKARYRNFGYLDSAENKRVPVAQRPSQDMLEKKARTFVTEQLRDFVRIGAGEELVPLFTEYQVSGGGSTARGGAREEEKVAGANVVYGRTINGVHVIGPGSKVAVIFGADGTLAGFDYDWPEYTKSTRTQKVLPVAEVRKRSRAVGAEDDQAGPERIECGYFDRGSGRRDAAASLQAACAVHTVRKTIIDREVYAKDPQSGHILVAQVTYVPAGETVEPDAKWREAQKIMGKDIPGIPAPGEGPKKPK